jgi:8-oxo-dGTP diphosphatase
VLLGYKKLGYGCGKYTGFGGKVEAGETILEAAVRELQEETSISVSESDLVHVGDLTFIFPHKPEWTQKVYAYLLTGWNGEAIESREMIPRWFDLDSIPYQGMWEDGRYWLPPILAGKFVKGRFVFNADNDTLSEVGIEDYEIPGE